ncbi:MAG TPA: TOBE domain-containing protein, partial [Desulfatirhabdiaceae bacterium]|nr:TOBE domain-containing protein [Desulfatirhabdiaceae bacterium]
GQRQRVAMGRAIVRKPAVFLFDEPLSNLDAKLRTQMRAEIKRLHQKVNATIIYVTHDQVEAMTLADRIVVLKDGRVEQVGNPIELFQHPVNTFVAGFIGSPPMNLVSATIHRNRDGLALVLSGGLSIPIPDKPGMIDSVLSEDMKVIMGLRTEDISIADETLSYPEAWVVEGTVDVVEPLGNETHFHVNLNGESFIARCEGRNPIKPGDRVNLSLNLNHLHVFDEKTCMSIY